VDHQRLGGVSEMKEEGKHGKEIKRTHTHTQNASALFEFVKNTIFRMVPFLTLQVPIDNQYNKTTKCA
jgi:hypothetical protein